MRRRTFLALATTGLATGTAGCAGIGGDGNDGTGGTDGTDTTGGTGGTDGTGTNPDATTSARTTDAVETTPTTASSTAPTTMTGETTTATTGRRTVTMGTTGGNNSSNGNSSSGGGGSGVSGRVTSVPDRLEVTMRQFYSGQFSTGVRGLLKNVSESPFEYVEVRATFYDAQGTRLDTGIDYDSGLAPGAEWPFDVVYRGSEDPSRIARYTLTVDTSPF